MAGLINVGILKPELGNALAAGYNQAEERRNLLAQQQQQRQLGELQLQNALREQRMAGEEEAAYKTAGSDYAKLQAELMQRGLGKQAMAIGAQQAKMQADKIAMLKGTTELMKSAASSVMENPTLENALAAVKDLGQRTGTDVSREIDALSKTNGKPDAIYKWAAGHAVSADKRLNEFKQFSVPGVGVQTGTTDFTGNFKPGQVFKEQMSEAQIEANKIAKRNADIAAGHLKVAQDKLAKEGTNLDPAENAAISKAIIEGRLDPNRVNGRNAKILATTLLANPDANVLELGVTAAGATASERSLATQTAKMSTAANEANKMVDVVRGLSDKVDRGEFPTINAISNAVSKGTGGKEIVQLNTSINALVNSYARAISPTGQPTVSDKNHAREIINSAYSQGQLGAILDVMQQEMSIARDAAGTASTELKASREAARGRAGAAPASNVVVTPDGQSHTFPNAAAAAQFKKAAGL